MSRHHFIQSPQGCGGFGRDPELDEFLSIAGLTDRRQHFLEKCCGSGGISPDPRFGTSDQCHDPVTPPPLLLSPATGCGGILDCPLPGQGGQPFALLLCRGSIPSCDGGRDVLPSQCPHERIHPRIPRAIGGRVGQDPFQSGIGIFFTPGVDHFEGHPWAKILGELLQQGHSDFQMLIFPKPENFGDFFFRELRPRCGRNGTG